MNNLEKLEEKIRSQESARKKKKLIKIHGRSIFRIKGIIKKRSGK